MKKENDLNLMLQGYAKKWSRKGLRVLGREIKQDTTIPGLIEDTFDNLGFVTKDRQRPVLVKRKKTEYGWFLIYNLPPGIAFQSIKRKVNFFSDAVKGFVSVEWNNALMMDIQINSLPVQVKYEPVEGKNMYLPVPVGVSQRGPEIFDLSSAPHLLVAGIPGFGKSNFLHVLIHSLLPYAWVVVIDLKRLEFSYLHKHVLLAKKESDAIEMLRALNKEHDRRVSILESHGCVKVQEYKGDDMPFIVVVIDEVAELRDEVTHELINRLLRLARATGISIVSATQRPSVKVIDGDSRAQYSARLCYLVADEVNSRMVLGEECPHAAYLPANNKGRAIFKFGQTLKEVQTMYLPIDRAKELIKEIEPRRWNIEQAKKLLPC